MAKSAVVEVGFEEGLFQSAHAALVFAFNFSGQCYDRPLMNRLSDDPKPIGKGLSGLDGAAQAGFIRAEVLSLGRLAEAILVARIAPRYSPCQCRQACCSGRKPNWEWRDAICFLGDHVKNTALKGCSSSAIMRREYVARYFTLKDKRESLEAFAEKHKVDRHTVSAHSAKVAHLFGGYIEKKDGMQKEVPGLESAATEAIEARLREIGMVGP